MKKFLIATGVAVLALATVVSAQGYALNTNLTVGSTGADVVALQSFLMTQGYSIPSIASGAAAKGYFGSQTKAAVVKYQAAKGIPNTGFVGPLTRAALNGSAVATPAPASCPAGYTCTPVAGTLPVVGSPVGISTPGVVGSLAISLWSTPSGIVAYKGQSYDVASYKVQASASDMAIQNLTLDFDARLWLYASAVTIKDDSGAIVGQVSNLGYSNFSELTVGSQYRLSVPVNGYVVKATQIKYLTVNISFLPTSDRSTGAINVTQVQVRSVDGTGVSDTATVGDDRSFSYQGSGAGSIIVTTDPASPQTGLVQLSTSAQTQNVTLAIFDVKSQNAASTLRKLIVNIRTAGGVSASSLFNNVKLSVGGQTYSMASTSDINNGIAAEFNSMSVTLPADTYVPLKIFADVAVDTNNTLDGTMSSTTLVANSSNVVAEDASYSTLSVNSASFTSNVLTFTGSGLNITSLATTYGSAITNSSTGTTTQQFSFVITATAGNNPIYISPTQSGTAASALSTSSAPSGITITRVNWSDNDTSGDASDGSYFYLAPGQTKTFTAIYSATGLSSAAGTFNVSAINFGTSSSAMTTGSLTSSQITTGLKAILFH